MSDSQKAQNTVCSAPFLTHKTITYCEAYYCLVFFITDLNLDRNLYIFISLSFLVGHQGAAKERYFPIDSVEVRSRERSWVCYFKDTPRCCLTRRSK